MIPFRKYVAVGLGLLLALGVLGPIRLTASYEQDSAHSEAVFVCPISPVTDNFQATLSRTRFVVEPDPIISSMMNQVDTATIAGYVGDLSGENEVVVDGSPVTIRTRHSGKPGMFDAAHYLCQYYESLGLSVELWPYGTNEWVNVVATQPGYVHPEQVYIICAHYDSRSETPATYAPGADDNASGTAAVMAAAGILSQHAFDYTIRYVGFSGEEQGLYGSHAYAHQMANLNEEILGVINLDMIAWDGKDGPAFDLHAGRPDSLSHQLARVFRDVVETYGLDLDIEIRLGARATDRSDHASFWDEGYAAFLAIEDWDDLTPWYHSTSDRLQTLDLEYFTDATKAAVGALAILADPLGASVPTPIPTSTATPWPTSTCPNILENGDFETGLSQTVWRTSSAGSYNVISSENPRQGEWSAWFNQENAADDSLCQTISLPADAQDVQLEFWWQMQTDEIVHGYDWLEVRIQREGASEPTVMLRLDDDDLQHLWEPVHLPLGKYAGEAADLCFVGHSDYWKATYFFVDDVYLVHCDNSLTPTPTVTPAPAVSWLPLICK